VNTFQNLISDLLLSDISEVDAQDYIFRKLFKVPEDKKEKQVKLDYNLLISSNDNISNEFNKLDKEFINYRDKNNPENINLFTSESGREFEKLISTNITDKVIKTLPFIIASHFIVNIKEHINLFLKMGSLEFLDGKRGDVSGAIIFLNKLDNLLSSLVVKCNTVINIEMEKDNSTGDTKDKIGGILKNDDDKLKQIQSTFETLATEAIDRHKMRLIVSAIGTDGDKGKSIRGEIKNELIKLNGIKKKLEDLLKNLLPRKLTNYIE
jgi:hypothetical protein